MATASPMENCQRRRYIRFWVEEERWTDAEDIAVGDWLRSEVGESFEVVDVWVETVESTRTYDLDIEEIDTFFVLGDEAAILVHNTGPCDPDIPSAPTGKLSNPTKQ